MTLSIQEIKESIQAACTDVDERFLLAHCARLPERYFRTFSSTQICEHAVVLSKVSPQRPVSLILGQGQGLVHCTVCGFDYPSVFSLITGVLASQSFGIQAGVVYTYSPPPPRETRRPGHRVGNAAETLERRRRIVDHFDGVLPRGVDFSDWSHDLEAAMGEVFLLLEKGQLAEAKRRVNERVASVLSDLELDSLAALYPVHMEVDEAEKRCTRITVTSEDTPFFLSSFSTALALRNISIEHVHIETNERRISDTFDLVDATGRNLGLETIDEVRLSLLLTKQFTYFLTRAPDPYTALTRFESLIDDILRLPQQGRWVDLLSNPRVMEDLAKLLGTSDFLWEDFIRTQYESLIPMLSPQVEGRRFSHERGELLKLLEQELSGATSAEEESQKLNAFKDREIYLIDLDHILTPDSDFRSLSEHLTRLAEAVVGAAFSCAYRRLSEKHGAPRTVAGLEARYAILGIGKLGGQALGYASDIEFITVYSDGGETAGPETIANAEFFELFVRDATGLIHTKREGIFHIDLRLRPYGGDGPLACSLDAFSRYYARGGPAHSFERLALVRMRAIAGDGAFGTTLELLRDRMVYAEGTIDLAELRALREKQLQEKALGGVLNAKFSRGALVDLEYAVQIMQVIHSGSNPRLLTPSIHRALDGLTAGGIIAQEEADVLVSAYRFLRNLINALRILRGSAQDLYLPDKESIEFSHLARRMGYSRRGFLPPETALYVDFETATASIRAFVERYFGQDTLPGPGVGNIADLVLSDEEPGHRGEKLLAELGFADPARAITNLRGLAGPSLDQREAFARLAILAGDILARKAAPDMALNNWERFVARLPEPRDHFRALQVQPMALDILLSIFSGSQFLSDTLIRDPDFLPWLVDTEHIHRIRSLEELTAELRQLSRETPEADPWLDTIRRFRRREILRIGTRDLVLGKPLDEIMTELTNLADAVAQIAVERIWATLDTQSPEDIFRISQRFSILALGKLGGRELNYSSDIDLFGIYDPIEGQDTAIYQTVMEKLRAALSSHTSEGAAYRVDFRLRPYGNVGPLAQPIPAVTQYYELRAGLWEIQALLKARPIAGALDVGYRFLRQITPLITKRRPGSEIAESIERMRDQKVQQVGRGGDATDVKSGLGGIRDIEFLVQGLQMLWVDRQTDLIQGSTLTAVQLLASHGLIAQSVAISLSDDYIFLRRVEHAIQILDDQQRHTLPKDPADLRALARRVLGDDSDQQQFSDALAACQIRVRRAYREGLTRMASETRAPADQ